MERALRYGCDANSGLFWRDQVLVGDYGVCGSDWQRRRWGWVGARVVVGVLSGLWKM